MCLVLRCCGLCGSLSTSARSMTLDLPTQFDLSRGRCVDLACGLPPLHARCLNVLCCAQCCAADWQQKTTTKAVHPTTCPSFLPCLLKTNHLNHQHKTA